MDKTFGVYRTVEGEESRRLKDLFDLVASRMIYRHDHWERVLIWVDIEPCDINMKPIETNKHRLVYSSYKEDSQPSFVDELIPKIGFASCQLSAKEYFVRRTKRGTSDGPEILINQIKQCYKATVNYAEYFDTPFDPISCGDYAEEKKWTVFSENLGLLKTCINESLPQFRNLVAWIDD